MESFYQVICFNCGVAGPRIKRSYQAGENDRPTFEEVQRDAVQGWAKLNGK